MRKLLTVAVAAATLTAGLYAPAVPAMAKPIVPDAAVMPRDAAGLERVQHPRYDRCYPGERKRDCRERRRWERNHGGRYYYRDGRYRDRDRGDAAAAAILGFALGAAITGSRGDYDYYYARRGDRRWHDRCRARYRSYDPYSGTYVTNRGYRRYCRL